MTKRFTLAELAKLTKSELSGDGDYVITGVADLESAGSADASFLSNPRYLDAMRKSKAGVVFIAPNQKVEKTHHFLINENPSRAFQEALEAFHGDHLKITGFTGIHPSAVVHPSAKIGKNATIAPNAVIDENVSIGENTLIGAGTYIGPGTTIGSNCVIHSNVSIRERSVIGSRVILQPGSVIGSCGFGLTTDASGAHSKLNQIGNVILEDDVEIGANTTIDRARFKSTIIKRGVKIDNLVQIGHNVIVGDHSIIVAQSGIAGSTELGKGVIMASQAGVGGHVKVADGSILTARTGVTKNLTTPGQPYGGTPAIPLNEHNRKVVFLRNIETYVKEIKELKKRVDELENLPK